MPRPSEHLGKMKGIRPGEWIDFGPYSRKLSDKLRHSLRNSQNAGMAPKGLRVVTSKDDGGKRLIVVHTPPKA